MKYQVELKIVVSMAVDADSQDDAEKLFAEKMETLCERELKFFKGKQFSGIPYVDVEISDSYSLEDEVQS